MTGHWHHYGSCIDHVDGILLQSPSYQKVQMQRNLTHLPVRIRWGLYYPALKISAAL